MKFHIFRENQTIRRAIILFAGWGMDEKPFSRLSFKGYNIISVYDYRQAQSTEAFHKAIKRYDEIVIIAWSFGVPTATRFIMENPLLPITARIAVNGTTHPVDDLYGIPETIFNATLEGLSENSLSKFYLRMCGSRSSYLEFAKDLPERPIADLREELSAIANEENIPEPQARPVWDTAIVGLADRIIPPSNQLRAWRENGEAFETIETDCAHLPDFNTIINRFITEKGRVAEKFSQAATTYDNNAVIQREIAENLCYLASSAISRQPINALEIGCGTGMTTHILSETLRPHNLTVWDLYIPDNIGDNISGTKITAEENDAETAIRNLPSDSVDLIFSASTVQWFNSLSTFLKQCSRVLSAKGTAVISTFGPKTMHEISDSLSFSTHYPSLEDIRRMIPGECTALHISEELRTLTFPTPMEALRHVKLTGVNALGGSHSGRDTLRVIRNYPLLPTGEAPITYHPIYIIFQKS